MKKLPGVYTAYLKNGDKYYRASITYQSKHISLGSFNDSVLAHKAYLEAFSILFDNNYRMANYNSSFRLSFHKWVVLHNYRDNGYYIKNPIYLHKYYFSYFLNETTELKFDVDDLFYYSNHKIFKKGGYLFVNDYGMQINILSRYGIKNYAVLDRDYYFRDSDPTNYRYHNIVIINQYYGVQKIEEKHRECYLSKIHIHGDYNIGKYSTEVKAAIAYNKAADYLTQNNLVDKSFQRNYIDLPASEYKKIYDSIKISPKIINLKNAIM